MSRNSNTTDVSESKPQMSSLSRQLSNTRRELELSEQINTELENIRSVCKRIADINGSLIDGTDLSKRELESLQRKKNDADNELKKLEVRYEMLKNIQKNECLINVKNVKIDLITKNNKFFVKNKEVFIEGIEYKDVVNNSDNRKHREVSKDRSRKYRAISDDTTIETYSENTNTYSGSTDDQSSVSSETELTGSERSDSILNRKRSSRKRIIPQRFESFPKQNRLRALNGPNSSAVISLIFMVFAVILYLFAFNKEILLSFKNLRLI